MPAIEHVLKMCVCQITYVKDVGLIQNISLRCVPAIEHILSCMPAIEHILEKCAVIKHKKVTALKNVKRNEKEIFQSIMHLDNPTHHHHSISL